MSEIIPVTTLPDLDGRAALWGIEERAEGRETVRITPEGDQERDILREAVLVSLGTWRRAERGQAPDDERRGWWGDPELGSRHWLLYRAGVVTPEALSDARAYLREALAWLVEDGIAREVEVEVSPLPDGLRAAVSVVRPDGQRLDLRFEPLWS